jgi:Holliday junction resolvase RusA-like endonuclease
LIIRLPVPPSVNNAFINLPQGGRAKGKAYTKWLKEADKWYQLQRLAAVKPILGPRAIHIRLPKVRGDIDNYAKLPIDYLVSRGLTGDDKLNLSLTVEVDPDMETSFCWITVTER